MVLAAQAPRNGPATPMPIVAVCGAPGKILAVTMETMAIMKTAMQASGTQRECG